MSEIADEFKIVVVEAIKALCLKFPQVFTGAWSAGSRQQLHRTRAAAALAEPAAPASRRQRLCACLLLTSHCLHPLFLQKYRGLMNFLSNILREDGGFEYKKASGWVVMACFGLGREGGGVGGERRGGMWVGEASPYALACQERTWRFAGPAAAARPCARTLERAKPAVCAVVQAIVDSILILIKEIPEAKEMGLAHL